MNKAIMMIGIIFLIVAVPLMFYSPVTWVNVGELSLFTDDFDCQVWQYNGEQWITMEDFKRIRDFVSINDFPIQEHHYLNLCPYRNVGISTAIFSAAIIIIGFVLSPRKLKKEERTVN